MPTEKKCCKCRRVIPCPALAPGEKEACWEHADPAREPDERDLCALSDELVERWADKPARVVDFIATHGERFGPLRMAILGLRMAESLHGEEANAVVDALYERTQRAKAAPAAPLVLTIACGPATTLDALEAAFLGSKWFPIRSRAGAGDAVHATVGDNVHATLRIQPGKILVAQAGTAKGAPARAKAVARFFERIAAGKPVARPHLHDETQG